MKNVLAIFKDKRILVAAALVVALIGIYFLKFHDPVLAKVGSIKIRKSEAKLRDEVIRLYFPDEKRAMGLFQLMKSAYNHEVLTAHTGPVPESTIDAEEARIEKSTRNPELLGKIKKIFGENRDAYRRVFVLPTLVDRLIYYEFFLNDEKIHALGIQQAMDFVKKASPKPSDFRKLAQVDGLEVKKISISSEGIEWETPESQKEKRGARSPAPKVDSGNVKLPVMNEAQEEVKKWQELLGSIKVGEIVPMPINYGEVWLVARYLKKKSASSYDVEVIPFRKLEFGKWFEEEKAKIKTEVYDSSLPVPK